MINSCKRVSAMPERVFILRAEVYCLQLKAYSFKLYFMVAKIFDRL